MRESERWRVTHRMSAERERDRASFAVATLMLGALGGLICWLFSSGAINFMEGAAWSALGFLGITVLSAAVRKDDPR